MTTPITTMLPASHVSFCACPPIPHGRVGREALLTQQELDQALKCLREPFDRGSDRCECGLDNPQGGAEDGLQNGENGADGCGDGVYDRGDKGGELVNEGWHLEGCWGLGDTVVSLGGFQERGAVRKLTYMDEVGGLMRKDRLRLMIVQEPFRWEIHLDVWSKNAAGRHEGCGADL